MEEKVRIARKALLEGVKPMTFRCVVRCCGEGVCDGVYCTDSELEIARDEMMYVLNSRIGHNEVFEDVAMMPFEVDQVLSDLAYECSWPNGDPYVTVADPVPNELQDLLYRIEDADPDDEEEYEELRSELQNLSDDLYTFRISVTDATGDYLFAEEEDYAVRLTAAEARGLIYGQVEDDELFRGMKCVCIGEEDIEAKLAALNVIENFDNLDYSGDSEELDAYVKAWEDLIVKILHGEIAEGKLPEWLQYFDDFEDNCDSTIEEWHDDF